jgi:hypothetical protein
MNLEDYHIGDFVKLRSGVTVKVTDKIDTTAPEVQENPDNISIGQDAWGGYHPFTPEEVVALVE